MKRVVKYLRKKLENLRSPYTDEVTAVRAGLKMQARNDASARLYRLCRYAHTLEKGLMMPNVRAVFGERHIRQAVDDYAGVLTDTERNVAECVDADQLAWVSRVLADYFSVVQSSTVVDEARRRFEAVNAGQGDLKRRESITAGEREAITVTYADFTALMKRRKSVRWFEDRRVPRELIDQAMDTARYAPSACNRQPFVFHIVDEPLRVKRVLDISWGVGGFKEQVPVVVVVVGRLRAFAAPHDRHLIYVDGSLAAMAFMLALETLGLASCPINWPDVAEKNAALRKVLKLDADERAVLMMGVGYPNRQGKVAASMRRSVHHLRKYVADS